MKVPHHHQWVVEYAGADPRWVCTRCGRTKPYRQEPDPAVVREGLQRHHDVKWYGGTGSW